jgi:hypothetical protein
MLLTNMQIEGITVESSKLVELSQKIEEQKQA